MVMMMPVAPRCLFHGRVYGTGFAILYIVTLQYEQFDPGSHRAWKILVSTKNGLCSVSM